MNKRCVIIGASPETDIEIIKKTVKTNDFIVCADGGYIFAKKANIIPNLIVGDFDSSVFPESKECETILLPVMKDDTDTNYCVKECVKRGFKNFILIGMTGGRKDHTFANLCTLKYLTDKGFTAEIIDKDILIFIMNKGNRYVINKNNFTFSVFPFACNSCSISLKGFLYELESGNLSADFPLGVSNQIISDKAMVTVHNGCAVIMISEII